MRDERIDIGEDTPVLPTCGRCRWWAGSSGQEPRGVYGECRRNAPRALYGEAAWAAKVENGDPVWPITSDIDYCGEFAIATRASA